MLEHCQKHEKSPFKCTVRRILYSLVTMVADYDKGTVIRGHGYWGNAQYSVFSPSKINIHEGIV